MDHVNYSTIEFESDGCMMWIDYEKWPQYGEEKRSVDLVVEDNFSLTTENIYGIIDELKKAAEWLQGDE